MVAILWDAAGNRTIGQAVAELYQFGDGCLT